MRPAGAAPNPYAQMAELPYPPAYNYGEQNALAPPGFKIPPGGMPQAPTVTVTGQQAPTGPAAV